MTIDVDLESALLDIGGVAKTLSKLALLRGGEDLSESLSYLANQLHNHYEAAYKALEAQPVPPKERGAGT